MTNPFFKNYGPLYLKDIYKVLGIKNDYYNKKDSTDISIPSSYDLDIREDYHLEKLQDTFGNMYLNILGEKKHLINFEYSKLRFVDSWVQEINKAS